MVPRRELHGSREGRARILLTEPGGHDSLVRRRGDWQQLGDAPDDPE